MHIVSTLASKSKIMKRERSFNIKNEEQQLLFVAANCLTICTCT